MIAYSLVVLLIVLALVVVFFARASSRKGDLGRKKQRESLQRQTRLLEREEDPRDRR